MKESIEDIFNRCKTILNFLKSQSPDNNSVNLFSDFENILNITYQSKNKRGIALINKDLEAWAKSLSKEKQKELNEILSGEDLYSEQKQIISKVLKKDNIDSKKEYNVIIEILKDINEQDDFFTEIEKLEKIVANYENR